MTDKDAPTPPESDSASTAQATADKPEPREAWDYPRHWIADVLAAGLEPGKHQGLLFDDSDV